jgi:hypothetical protein
MTVHNENIHNEKNYGRKKANEQKNAIIFVVVTYTYNPDAQNTDFNHGNCVAEFHV